MKIQKNPQLSPMYDLDQSNEMKSNVDLDSFGAMTWNRWAILISLVVVLGIIVYGGLKLDWDMANFAAMFLWLAILVGFLDGKTPSGIAKGLVAGCKTMLGAALIIGLARSIALILTAGGIIDTIVYALAGVLNVVPSFLQAPVMFIINLVINIFVTSGSGQAAVVMPLFLPVADLVGMTAIPQVNGKRAIILQGQSLAMFDNYDEEGAKITWKFIKALEDPEFQASYAINLNSIPCRLSSLENTFYASWLNSDNPYARANKASLIDIEAFVNLPVENEYSSLISSLLNNVEALFTAGNIADILGSLVA